MSIRQAIRAALEGGKSLSTPDILAFVPEAKDLHRLRVSLHGMRHDGYLKFDLESQLWALTSKPLSRPASAGRPPKPVAAQPAEPAKPACTEVITPDWIVIPRACGGVVVVNKETGAGMALDAEVVAAIRGIG
jgi:hypothetical protein